MTFDEMIEAVNSAERDIRMAEVQLEEMIIFVSKRLRKAHPSWLLSNALAHMKSELRDFNAVTRRWK